MAAKKGNTHGFKKGHTGNPGGRPKNDPDVMRIFHANCEKAALKLVKLLDSDDPVQVERVSMYIMNRCLGRPRESIEVKGDVPSFVIVAPQPSDDADVWEAQAQKVLGGHAEH